MSPPFAILRIAKLKTFGNLGASLEHTYRARETPNADPARAIVNEHSHGDPGAVLAALKARLPEKRRKDAVLAIEYFVGASPEWFSDGKDGAEYFKAAVAWLEARHGAENVVGWSIHRDESTPHLVAFVVPLDDRGKLNAKGLVGSRAQLSNMQTDFAKNVGAAHGLERGIEGSKAKHTRVKVFYAGLGKPGLVDAFLEKTIEERDSAQAEAEKLRDWKERFIDLLSPREMAEMMVRMDKKKQAEAVNDDDGPSLG